MRVVNDIKFDKIVPFNVASNRFNELLYMLSLFRDTMDDIDYFLSDSEHLYLPIFIKNKIEVFLEFDFTEDDKIELTFGELNDKLLKVNNKFAEAFSNILLGDINEDHICFRVFYYYETTKLDCIDVRTFSDKWTAEVAKNKLLGISNKNREEKRIVSIVKNGVKMLGLVIFGYTTHRAHTFEVFLSIIGDFDEIMQKFDSGDFEDFVIKKYNERHSYYAGVICVDFSNSYMSVMAKSKDLFGLFQDVSLEVL